MQYISDKFLSDGPFFIEALLYFWFLRTRKCKSTNRRTIYMNLFTQKMLFLLMAHKLKEIPLKIGRAICPVCDIKNANRAFRQ